MAEAPKTHHTPRERVVLAYKGGFADRVPAYPIAGSFAGCLDGLSIEEYCTNPTKATKAMLNYYERYEPDIMIAFNDLAKEAEAIGCHVKYSDYVVPSIDRHVLQDDRARLATLEIPDPKRDGRLPAFLRSRPGARRSSARRRVPTTSATTASSSPRPGPTTPRRSSPRQRCGRGGRAPAAPHPPARTRRADLPRRARRRLDPARGRAGRRLDTVPLPALAPRRGQGALEGRRGADGGAARAALGLPQHAGGRRRRPRRGQGRRRVVRELLSHEHGTVLSADALAPRVREGGPGGRCRQHDARLGDHTAGSGGPPGGADRVRHPRGGARPPRALASGRRGAPALAPAAETRAQADRLRPRGVPLTRGTRPRPAPHVSRLSRGDAGGSRACGSPRGWRSARESSPARHS